MMGTKKHHKRGEMSERRINLDTLTLTQEELSVFLERVAPYRPIFVWGQPGIGKSAIVEQYATKTGLECVALLGSQLSPEDIIGIPQIMDGTFRFCPPRLIAKHEAYCLFLDEFNACSFDVQKVFYTLIHDRRIGEYKLPEGSIVIAAGNRAQDYAIVNQLSSALINRMVHVHMESSTQDWLTWARENYLHPLIIEYIEDHPGHLTKPPTSDESPYSTPRSWHILSDALRELSPKDSFKVYQSLCYGSISEDHAAEFLKFAEKKFSAYSLHSLLNETLAWPRGKEKQYEQAYLVFALFDYLKRRLPAAELDIEPRHADLIEKGRKALESLWEINPDFVERIKEKYGKNPNLTWFLKKVHFQTKGKDGWFR